MDHCHLIGAHVSRVFHYFVGYLSAATLQNFIRIGLAILISSAHRSLVSKIIVPRPFVRGPKEARSCYQAAHADAVHIFNKLILRCAEYGVEESFRVYFVFILLLLLPTFLLPPLPAPHPFSLHVSPLSTHFPLLLSVNVAVAAAVLVVMFNLKFCFTKPCLMIYRSKIT